MWSWVKHSCDFSMSNRYAVPPTGAQTSAFSKTVQLVRYSRSVHMKPTVVSRIHIHSAARFARVRTRICLLRQEASRPSKTRTASSRVKYKNVIKAMLGSEYCAMRTRLLRHISRKSFDVSSQPGWRASISN